jgi:hypothetical protein
MKTALKHLEDAGYKYLNEGMGGTMEELIRAAQIDALWWAESILRAQTTLTTRWHIAQKIQELEKL